MNAKILPALAAVLALGAGSVLAIQNAPDLHQAEATPEVAVEVTPESTAEQETSYPGAKWVEAGGLRFELPAEVARGVTATDVEAVPLQPDALFGDSLPAHTRIEFVDYMPKESDEDKPDFFLEPVIYVFDTADFEAYESPDGYGYVSELGLLTGILEGTIRRSRDTILPYLPVVNAAQILRARETFVEPEDARGLAYLVTFGHDVSPIVEGGVQFTFQGLTDDGTTYIAAIFPINTGYFVHELGDDFDYEAFAETFEEYLVGTRDALEAQTSDAFTPNLDALLALVGSIQLAE
jgi:hypothetical protein